MPSPLSQASRDRAGTVYIVHAAAAPQRKINQGTIKPGESSMCPGQFPAWAPIVLSGVGMSSALPALISGDCARTPLRACGKAFFPEIEILCSFNRAEWGRLQEQLLRSSKGLLLTHTFDKQPYPASLVPLRWRVSALLTGSGNGLVHLGAFLPQRLLKIADVKTQMSAAAMALGGVFFSFVSTPALQRNALCSFNSPLRTFIVQLCNRSRIVKVGGYLSMQSVWVPVKHDAIVGTSSSSSSQAPHSCSGHSDGQVAWPWTPIQSFCQVYH